MQLDAFTTLAFAALILALGEFLRRQFPALVRHNLPGPVVSGLLLAAVAWWWWWRGGGELVVDAGVRVHLQCLFFACIGLSSNGRVAHGAAGRAAGLWAAAIAISVVQNLLGIGLALALGEPAALGIACGSASLVEGPAAGLAYAGQLEAAGLSNAGAICISAAAFGIVAASLLGNPVATWLICRGSLEPGAPRAVNSPAVATLALHMLALAGLAWTGLLLSGPTGLPPYIVAMMAGLGARWLCDHSAWQGLDVPTLRRLGALLSSLFLAYALMDLRFEQLAALNWRSVLVLSVQVVTTVILAVLLVRWWMGAEYEGAVATAGSIGFTLGITPNVVANMSVLGRRYGPAPEAMLAVPLTGTYLIGLSGPWIFSLFLKLIQP